MSGNSETQQQGQPSADSFVDNWALVWSAAGMAIPFILSLFYSPFGHSIVIGFSTLWSLLYHMSGQRQYEQLDVITAVILTVVNMYLIASATASVPWYDFRAVMATLFGAGSLALLFSAGFATESDTKGGSTLPQDTIHDYKLYHSIWHLMGIVATLFVISLHGHFDAAWTTTPIQILKMSLKAPPSFKLGVLGW